MMLDFFEKTSLSQLTFASESNFINISALSWTMSQVQAVYWRSCYSYILCSTIAFFEDAFDEAEKERIAGKTVRYRSMALTGVQGTGKSLIGSIIALILARAYGWCVKYTWNRRSVHFGKSDSTKQVNVVDFNVGPVFFPDSQFVLYVTSANHERWHDASQQGVWTENKGNYLFIDPVPYDEISAMGQKQGLRDDVIRHNYDLAGGVARLCLEDKETVVKKVEGALKTFELIDAIKSLARLSDKSMSTKSGDKFYPGLIAHICPTDPFRNLFTIGPCSPKIRAEFTKMLQEKSESDIEALMNNLISLSQARGFAGMVWELLFTEKAKKDSGQLIIAGTELPAKKCKGAEISSRLLLRCDCKDIATFEFKDFNDFSRQFDDISKTVDGNKIVLAKAKDDNFIAVDAILVFKRNDVLSVIGLQMTVARCRHTLNEQGIIQLVQASHQLKNKFRECETALTNIWFLQPEKCLSDFDFTGLQPLTFAEDRVPSAQESKDTSSRKRHRKAPKRYGEFVTGDPKRQSNNPEYWDESVKGVSQYVAVVRFVDSPDSPMGPSIDLASSLAETLNNASNADATTGANCLEPSFRPWTSTKRVAEELTECQEVPNDFSTQILEDLAKDEEALVSNGFKIGEVSRQQTRLSAVPPSKQLRLKMC